MLHTSRNYPGHYKFSTHVTKFVVCFFYVTSVIIYYTKRGYNFIMSVQSTLTLVSANRQWQRQILWYRLWRKFMVMRYIMLRWQTRPMMSIFVAVSLTELRPTNKGTPPSFVVRIRRNNNVALYRDLFCSNSTKRMFTPKSISGKRGAVCLLDLDATCGGLCCV
jgi:hypothetical protein